MERMRDSFREHRLSQYEEVPDDPADIPLASFKPTGRRRAGTSVLAPDSPFADYDLGSAASRTTYDPFNSHSSYTPYTPNTIRAERAERNSLLSIGSSLRTNRRFIVGWRFGVINCAVSVAIVLLLNISLTIAVAARTGFKNSRGTLHDGNCTQARQLNTGLHLLINVFSTVLLASSNYCMQCLSAPTRADIDRAHAKEKTLDIGIPSTHNLRYIGWKRAMIWAALGLSSLPLHLLYVHRISLVHSQIR